MKKITFTVVFDYVPDANVDEIIEKVNIAIAKLHSGVVKAIDKRIACSTLARTQQLYHIKIGDELLCQANLNPGRESGDPEYMNEPALYPSAQAAWRKIAYIADGTGKSDAFNHPMTYERNNKSLTVVKAEG
jgi:hypothetical protein